MDTLKTSYAPDQLSNNLTVNNRNHFLYKLFFNQEKG